MSMFGGLSGFRVSMGRHSGKVLGLLLVAVIGVSGAAAIFSFQQQGTQEQVLDEFYFGVSFGGQTVEEAKILVDRVKDYTNVFLINSYDLSVNESALNEVCDYVAQSGLRFTVYFEFVSRVTYPWHQTWLDSAPVRWGDSFLGVYFYDDPEANNSTPNKCLVRHLVMVRRQIFLCKTSAKPTV